MFNCLKKFANHLSAKEKTKTLMSSRKSKKLILIIHSETKKNVEYGIQKLIDKCLIMNCYSSVLIMQHMFSYFCMKICKLCYYM